MGKRIFKIILSCLALTFVYFLLDISELPACIGIHSEKINWDIASIVISNLVVICLFLITFNLLDNRSIEKDKNQRDVAVLILNKTYGQCKDVAALFDNPSIRASAVKKCDFNKVVHEDKAHMRYLEAPFEYHEKIVDLSFLGIISQQEFSDYVNVKAVYTMYINTSITFFDKEAMVCATYIEFLKKLDYAIKRLNSN